MGERAAAGGPTAGEGHVAPGSLAVDPRHSRPRPGHLPLAQGGLESFAARPERFPRGAPSAGILPTEVWINKPQLPSPTEETRQ
jgi:hypothetical protein